MLQYNPWRTFSIFISSTFADMQAERDHLKNVVFPHVEEELQKRLIKLEIVDLRWGVDTASFTQEEEREVNVLKVCLDEIKRCRPFFIGLLGDRYGWVPPVKRLEDALVGEPHIKPEKGKSVTDLEIEFGVLASKEQLVRSVFYFREPLPYATFSKKKAAMFCDDYNPELNEAEKKERRDALEKLKSIIGQHFKALKQENKVKTYQAAWDTENEKVTGLKSWGDVVYTDILAECENHARDTWDQVPKNWQEQELALLDAFIEQHTHITVNVTDGKSEKIPSFCGREELIKELTKHLLSDDSDNWGVVLTGESGSGKSAVFSMVNKLMQERKDCFILAHSAGLSSRAKSVADLLKIWNRQLATLAGLKEEVVDETMTDDERFFPMPGQPDTPKTTPIEKLQEKFLELLQILSAQKRVVLLIDALDRFESTPRAQHLSWLPTVMPQNVRMLCTAITGTEQKATQYHKGLAPKSIEIFSKEEAQEMLNVLCKKNHKTLNEAVRKIILEKKRNGGPLAISSPLWLSLTANMLMALDQDDFEKISKLQGSGGEQIETYLARIASEFDPLPGPLFINLTQKAGEVFGSSFTKAVFDYIAISRNGLRERDLEKLLHDKNWDDLQFANLRRWFKAHLVLQGKELQWNLAHSILRNTLRENLSLAKFTELHFKIAGYLLSLPETDDMRITETMFHLLESEKLTEAAKYYADIESSEEIDGATKVLAEAVVTDEKGITRAIKLPELLKTDNVNFYRLVGKYIFSLDESLINEGKINLRLTLLNKLNELLLKVNCNELIHVYTHAKLLDRLGSVHHMMGNIDDALKSYNDSNYWLKRLLEPDPKNALLRSDLAVSYKNLGLILEEKGRFEDALMFCEYANRLLVENLIPNQLSLKSKKQISNSFFRIGVIHSKMGDSDDGLKYFEEGSNIMKELVESNPQNASLKFSLAIEYSALARIHSRKRNTDVALKFYEEALKLSKELYETNPQDIYRKTNLAMLYSSIGDFHQKNGNVIDGLKYYKEGFVLKKEVFDFDPKNEVIRISLTLSYKDLISIFRAMGDLGNALKYLEDSNSMIKKLFDSNQQSESLKNDLADSFKDFGEILLTMGKPDDALKYFEDYNHLIKGLSESNQLNDLYKISLATSYRRLGEVYQSKNNIDTARMYFEKGLLLTKKLFESNPQNETVLINLVESYGRLVGFHMSTGNKVDALKYCEYWNPLSKKLYEMNLQDTLLKKGFVSTYFVLGDINYEIGNMNEALKYFENYNQLSKELLVANPQDESIKSGLEMSYEKLGNLYLSKGNLNNTLSCFEERSKLCQELHDSKPENIMLKYGLATSYFQLGETHWKVGNKNDALKYYTVNNQLIKELYESSPLDKSLKTDLATSYDKIGSIHWANENMNDALVCFEKRLKLSQELYDSNQKNNLLKFDLATSYAQLGEIHRKVGNKKDALQYLEGFSNLIKELYDEDPQNEIFKKNLLHSYSVLGDTNFEMNNSNETLEYFERSIELYKELIGSNLSEIKLIEGLGTTYYKLAMIYKLLGNNKKGIGYFGEWRKIILILSSKLPQELKYKEWNNLVYDLVNEPSNHINEVNQNSSAPQKAEKPRNLIQEKPFTNSSQPENFNISLQKLTKEEAIIRRRPNNGKEFQANMGEQGHVLCKLGRYKDALEKYDIQSEICARNKMDENYAKSLIFQANILLKHLNKPKHAKTLLLEAMSIAKDNSFNNIIMEAENMLNGL